MDRLNTVAVIIMGLGNVGRALLRQILDTRQTLAQRNGLRLAVTGLVDSVALLSREEGLPDSVLTIALDVKKGGRALSVQPGSLPPDRLTDLLQPGAILVDLTASTETVSFLHKALKSSCYIALANKHPLSGLLSQTHALLDHRAVRYEATVGAGLPVIATLRTLMDAGDQITSLEGCLSGTLGYLCAQLERGVSFSEAVRQAHALGYTEPDPRQDLGGLDVARKALILARTSGWPLEMSDITVSSLYPDALLGVSVQEFMSALPSLDADLEQQTQAAHENGQVLRFTARVGAEGGRVGLVSVDQHSLLGALRGPANYIAFHSARYAHEPLVISGPGAGPEVTAAGVLGDIVDLALRRTPDTSKGRRSSSS